MKKTLLLITFSIFTVLGIHAQERSNSIKVNPLALWDGSDLLSYERAVSKHSSLLLGVGVGAFRLGGSKYKSQGASLQYRYYFTEAINKLYLGALIHYQGGEVKTGKEGTVDFFLSPLFINQNVDFQSLGGGFKTGCQWTNEGGLTLDLNIGVSYLSLRYKERSFNTVALKEKGIIPTFGFGLGYSW